LLASAFPASCSLIVTPSPLADTGTSRDDAGAGDADGDAGPDSCADAVPPVPDPIWPENGAYTGSPHAAARGTLRPLLRWRHEDDACGAVTFDVQITPGSASCAPGRVQRCDFPEEATVEGTTAEAYWRPAEDLAVAETAPVGERYYWRVCARRGAACSDWSTVRYVDVGRVPCDFNGDGYSDLAVGAPGTTNGDVCVYLGGDRGIEGGAPPDVTRPGSDDGVVDWFGYAVACAGDLNVDGFADLLVGIPGPREGAETAGMAAAFLGAAAEPLAGGPQPLPPPDGATNGTAFGRSVAAAGDIDGDGWADVAVGAPVWNDAAVNAGQAFVFFGGPAGIDGDREPAPLVFEGELAERAHFGDAVAAAGDLNGDGDVEVAVGAATRPGEPITGGGGAVFLYGGLRGEGPFAPASRIDPPPENPSAPLGTAVAWAGDVAGDGWGDLIAAAPAEVVFAYWGGAADVGPDPDRTYAVPDGFDDLLFGASVAAAGDRDGDGCSGIAVGAPSRGSSPAPPPGHVFVYEGAGDGDAPLDLRDPESSDPLAIHFGGTVASPGDLDGNGRDDLVAGMPPADRFPGDAAIPGKVTVFQATADGARYGVPVTLRVPGGLVPGESGAHFGGSIASGGFRAAPAAAPCGE
jgi:hypothetical protein